MVLLTAGCASRDSVQAIFPLEPVDTVPGRSTTRVQLLVPEPSALASLDTARIAVKPSPETLSYYPRVAWEDDLPRVFQFLLLESLQNTGRVEAVGLPGQSLLINYQIITEIRAFYAEAYGADVARVAVAAKILNDRNGQVVATRLFETTVPLAGDTPETAVAGLQAAASRLITDMVAWILATV